MRIGKQVKFKPVGATSTALGIVIWVHPRQRYCMVQYKLKTMLGVPSRPLLECFQLNGDRMFLQSDNVRMVRGT